MSRIDIVTLDVDGVRALLDRAAAEGWNPGLGDAEAFHAADPDGFLARRVDGAFAAGISVVRQDAAHGFLGLYIAAPEARGRGHGLGLWREALERAEARGLVSIGLDGVVEQQANYRRSGFAFAHRNLRYRGDASALSGAVGVDHALEVRAVAAADAEGLVALDGEIGEIPRAAFLAVWLRGEATRTSLVAFAAGARVEPKEAREGGADTLPARPGASAPAGFGTVRRCRDGHKIGPLIARTPDVARRLLGALAARAAADDPGGALVVDVPEPNVAAVAALEKAGFARVFETARMYRGPAPAIDTARLWGVGTLELG